MRAIVSRETPPGPAGRSLALKVERTVVRVSRGTRPERRARKASHSQGGSVDRRPSTPHIQTSMSLRARTWHVWRRCRCAGNDGYTHLLCLLSNGEAHVVIDDGGARDLSVDVGCFTWNVPQVPAIASEFEALVYRHGRSAAPGSRRRRNITLDGALRREAALVPIDIAWGCREKRPPSTLRTRDGSVLREARD